MVEEEVEAEAKVEAEAEAGGVGQWKAREKGGVGWEVSFF